MSLKKSLLSALRITNFIFAERAWRVLSAEADFQVDKILPKKNVLIIAPHPDDEIFGCAGVLSVLPNEAKIKILTIFSGDEKSKSKIVDEREAESIQAVRLLTNPEQIFFRQLDGGAISKGTISELAQIIKDFDNPAIFLPSFSDINPDHLAVSEAVSEALKIAAVNGAKVKEIPLWLYQIWSPLPHFNRLIEFDWQKKASAMEKFESQKKERNYPKAIKSLNEYYGEIYGLKKPAEAFFALPADLFIKLYSKEKND